MDRNLKILWQKLRDYGRCIGADLPQLGELLGFNGATLEYMAQKSLRPTPEMMKAFRSFTGHTADELMDVSSTKPIFDAIRPVLVYADLDASCTLERNGKILTELNVDVPQDGFDYFFSFARDDAMSGAHIFKDDLLMIRRCRVADDGDIVLAAVGGTTVLRRYHRVLDAIWLESEGPVIFGNARYTDNLAKYRNSFEIRGKVIRAVRNFE